MDQIYMAAVNNQTSMAGDESGNKISGDMPGTAGNACFDCNICLDFAAEPVVTLCGHLYCWPCIYEWLRPGVESAASDKSSLARRQCPVCKAALSPDMLVPLYGRGGSLKKSLDDLAIPRRPSVHRETVEHQNTQNNINEPSPPLQPQRHASHHSSATELDFIYPPSPMGRGLIHSTAGGVLGGMAVAVLPWAFRGQVPPSMSSRLRRQQIEVERSLHQIWFFLFVLVVLCLLLF